MFVLISLFLGIHADHCGVKTPSAAAGPFFQEAVPDDKGSQNWCIPTGSTENLQYLYVNGTIISHETCAPVANAEIDVWQSDDQGIYDSTQDANDHNCRTVIFSDENGYYEYWTFKPPQYIAGLNVYRPAHIHLTVRHPDHQSVTTQMYFEGDPWLGENDTACGQACSSDDPNLITSPVDMPDGTQWVRFNFRIDHNSDDHGTESEIQYCEVLTNTGISVEECQSASTSTTTTTTTTDADTGSTTSTTTTTTQAGTGNRSGVECFEEWYNKPDGFACEGESNTVSVYNWDESQCHSMAEIYNSTSTWYAMPRGECTDSACTTGCRYYTDYNGNSDGLVDFGQCASCTYVDGCYYKQVTCPSTSTTENPNTSTTENPNTSNASSFSILLLIFFGAFLL